MERPMQPAADVGHINDSGQRRQRGKKQKDKPEAPFRIDLPSTVLVLALFAPVILSAIPFNAMIITIVSYGYLLIINMITHQRLRQTFAKYIAHGNEDNRDAIPPTLLTCIGGFLVTRDFIHKTRATTKGLASTLRLQQAAGSTSAVLRALLLVSWAVYAYALFADQGMQDVLVAIENFATGDSLDAVMVRASTGQVQAIFGHNSSTEESIVPTTPPPLRPPQGVTRIGWFGGS